MKSVNYIMNHPELIRIDFARTMVSLPTERAEYYRRMVRADKVAKLIKDILNGEDNLKAI